MTELAIREGQTAFDARQLAALAQVGVENASRADQAIFFHQCVRTGLDPFARQIYMIGRQSKNKRTSQWETKWTIQTGIDGFRLIARRAVDRRRETLGYAETQWCGDDGEWTDVWLHADPPRAAKVAVLRDGHPFPAVALWTEYAQTDREGRPTSMWARMPTHMLEKCAEAAALRKAFPQELSGLYTTDETGDDVAPVTAVDGDDAPRPGSKRISRRVLVTPAVDAVAVDAEFEPDPPEDPAQIDQEPLPLGDV